MIYTHIYIYILYYIYIIYIYYISYKIWLVFSIPLNNMTSSVGMMKFHSQHNIWKVIQKSMVPVTTNQIWRTFWSPRHRGQPTVHLHRHEISLCQRPRGPVDAHVGLPHVDAAHAVHGQHRGRGVRKRLHAIHIEVLRAGMGENCGKRWKLGENLRALVV